ncbi:hypothetical protein BKA66DRAFT_508978 [Pyrenochaeta sp. MPI-SDFR-AT-0127]|nr:hypothetical protein BKA66DRAFT_508978 [Pyrenochaeta sp. MPI-SDFR-AT-0127]
MSIQLCVRNPQERCFRAREQARNLIRACQPPESPAVQGICCNAVATSGRRCHHLLSSEDQSWCAWHLKELNKLHVQWEGLQYEADSIEVCDAETAKEKVLKLRLTVELRRRIRERFHTRGVDTMDFVGWLFNLEEDIKAIAEKVLVSSVNQKSDTPAFSPLGTNCCASLKAEISPASAQPGIPRISLQRMPDDEVILALKIFSADLCTDVIRRLYTILPDLHYSSPRSDSPIQDHVLSDTGANIICSWFRIMILNDSDAEALERATRSKSIGDFLSGCQASQLEMYCDFFENAWRPHAVQYLRVAICAQTLAGGDIKTIQILGGSIPSTSEGLRMTKPCWDILYRWFPTLLTPWTIASICSNFEDYITICKLLTLGLYREHWYDSANIMNECPTGIHLGFIPTNKGDFTAADSIKQEEKGMIQSESRNYLCGQMAIGDPMTKYFLDELRKRTERLYLVVYEGTNVDATVHPTEPDLFIKRSRVARPGQDVNQMDWSTTITLEDIKNDLRLRKTSIYDPIVVDSWQFLIIDRDVGMPFELIDIVQDILLLLAGDPSPRKIARRVVSEVIPPSVQDIYLEEMTIKCSADLRFPPPPEAQYEGHRYRCHDPDQKILTEQQKASVSGRHSRDANRLIRRTVEDMERCGIISLLPEYEKPQTRPIIVQGSDGALDIYFPYDRNDTVSMVPHLPLPSENCLLDFALMFKKKHPTAIMAKGSIQTHYCAWPMPVIKSLGNIGLTFATWEGHVYRWNAMPFDRPWSANAWQYYIQHCINSRYPFVMFYLTTFVICAVDQLDAEDKVAALLEETEDRGWKIVLPRADNWKTDINELKLDKLYEGVRPA